MTLVIISSWHVVYALGYDLYAAYLATIVSLYLGGLSSDKSSFIGPYSFEDDLQPVEKNMQ